MRLIRRFRTWCPEHTQGRPSERGFTLVEFLISSIILLILMGGTVSVFQVSQSLNNTTQQGLELQQSVRSVQRFIYRDLINAGSGLPYVSSINGTPPLSVPAGAKLGPLGAAISGTSVYFISPGNSTGQSVTKDGEGTTLGSAIPTDILTVLGGQGEARFVNQNAPGPTSGWGAEVFVEDNSIFAVGQVVLITNGFQVSLGQVTQILNGGGLQFSSGLDPLNLNAAASSGTPNPNYYAATQFPGGPPPQAIPLSSITYFVDSATNPTRPCLKRLSNSAVGAAAGIKVIDDVENFQIQYLVDDDANATTANALLDAPLVSQLSLVRGATITVTGRSRVKMRDMAFPDRHSRLTLTQTIFFRNNIRR